MVKIGTFYKHTLDNDLYFLSRVSNNKCSLININSGNRWSDKPIKSEKDIPVIFKPFYGDINIQSGRDQVTVEYTESIEEILKEKYAQGITKDEIRKLLKEYRKDEHSI